MKREEKRAGEKDKEKTAKAELNSEFERIFFPKEEEELNIK